MLIDARQISSGNKIMAAVCIIGAGAAGITLAREFAGTSTDIVVLESGGLTYNSATQALARGAVTGLHYSDLEGERVRQLGGCTDHWGGECRPLDPEDFSVRDWMSYSGWPITAATLAPYYQRAASVVEIAGHDRFAAQDWDSVIRGHPEMAALHFTGGVVSPRVFQNSPPTRFGKRYRAELDAAANVRVLLNANFVGFETDETRRHVLGVKVACLGGPTFTVQARQYIVATGTIENARLLLAASGSEGRGFGNDHGMVGRFFHEHIAHPGVAEMLPAEHPSIAAYKAVIHQGTIAAAFTQEAQCERRLNNFTVFFDAQREGSDPPPVRSFKTLVGGLRERMVPDRLWTHLGQVMSDLPAVARYAVRRVSTGDEPVGFFEMTVLMEQVPNPDSRVRLGRERDALGIPMPELDWQVTDLDRVLMLRALDYTAREIGASGLGRVKMLMPEDGGDWTERLTHSHHPMGTTRMHDDPRFGVVDANCRVHGMDNLYVAGASVFTNGGAASPTYSIVALAIRLADHVKSQIA
jgi:choline dehydrogenase-like flavoprotein